MKIHKNLIFIIIFLFACSDCLSCGKKQVVYVTNTEDSKEEDLSVSEMDADTESQKVEEEILVFVCGAVVYPGVYSFEDGDRVMDAVEAAGGFLPEACQVYWNLAEHVTDGQMIYIPTNEEVRTGAVEKEPQIESSVEDGKININTADKEALMKIPGVGATRAERILAYREEHGPFAEIEDIMQVSGIKEGVYAKIKEYIKVK